MGCPPMLNSGKIALMPHENTCAQVLVRDGFLCRYCGARLYLGPAVKLLDLCAPDLELYDRHGKAEPLRHLWATVDHVKPLQEGGTDCLENLVACCVRCNSSMTGSLQGERAFAIEPGWTGYAECFLALADRFQEELTETDLQWKRALEWAGVTANPIRVASAIEELRETKGLKSVR